jgi:hypothetical protein
MKEPENDKMLKSLIKEIHLDKPGDKFTLNVMNKVFDIAAAKSQIRKLKILGVNFWIFVLLFVVLGAALVIFSSTGAGQAGGTGGLLPSLNTGKVASDYNSILGFFGKVPLIIPVFLIASSLLLLLERFLSKRRYLAQKD